MRWKLWAGVLVVGAALWFGKTPILGYWTSRDVEFTVQRTERVVDADGSGARYLVWTTDGNTFQNVDNMWFWKWNSSDVQGRLVAGAKVKAHVTGVRFGFFSWYPNIISAEPIQ